MTVGAAKRLDVVVRFDNLKHMAELERCLFSLIGQEYRPMHIILALQRFSILELDLLRSRIAPLNAAMYASSITVLNWEHKTPEHAWPSLLNLGVKAATGRYLAFIDYDDVLYPEAYRLLVTQLETSGADIAFAKIRTLQVEAYDSFYFPRLVLPSLAGSGLSDLFQRNFSPLHSFVIDRTKIPGEVLFFEPDLVVDEGYDLILRLCAHFVSDFSLVQTEIGDTYQNIGPENAPGSTDRASAKQRLQVASFIEQRRHITVLSEQVQRALGLSRIRSDVSVSDFIGRSSEQSP